MRMAMAPCLVETDEVEGILADVEADRGNRIGRLVMGVHRELLKL